MGRIMVDGEEPWLVVAGESPVAVCAAAFPPTRTETFRNCFSEWDRKQYGRMEDWNPTGTLYPK